MQSENRVFDDIAKMLNGVAGTMAGMGREAQDAMRERMNEFSGGLDFVSREEFDAVKEMAAKARAEAELLAERVEKLEAKLGVKARSTSKKTAKRKPAARKATAKRTTAKKAAAKKPAKRRKPAAKK